MSLGNTIKQMRESRKWTLEDLSKRSGVPIGTISALEVRNSVRSQYAKDLARGFGISLDDLESGIDATPPAPSSAIATTSSQPVQSVDREPNIPRFAPGRMGSESRVEKLLSLLAEDLQDVEPAKRDAVVSVMTALIKSPTDTSLIAALKALMEPAHVDVNAHEQVVTKKKHTRDFGRINARSH